MLNTKKIRAVCALLLSIALVWSAIPISPVQAEGNNFGLVYNAADGKLHKKGANGAVYESENYSGHGNTLTLRDFHFETTEDDVLRVPDGTVINIEGDNSLISTVNYMGSSALTSNGSILITGGGSLQVTGGTGTCWCNGIMVKGDLTLRNVTINASTESILGGPDGRYGIRVDGNLLVEGGAKINAVGYQARVSSCGISAKAMTVRGASHIEAVGKTTGIYLDHGPLIIEGNSNVVASGMPNGQGIDFDEKSPTRILSVSDGGSVVAEGARAVNANDVTAVNAVVRAGEDNTAPVLTDPAYNTWKSKKWVNIESETGHHTVLITNGADGASGKGVYSADDTVAINAGTKAGYTFDHWTVTDGVELADANAIQTSFTMPNHSVVAQAHWTANSYQLSVSGGGSGATESGSYATDETVRIKAGTKEGHRFDRWVSRTDGFSLAQPTDAETSFPMPPHDVAVQATWLPKSYKVTLIDGGTDATGAGSYAFQSTVSINAGTKAGHVFDRWTAEGITLDNPNAATTSFAMPANHVSLTANWAKLYNVNISDGGSGVSGSGQHGEGRTVAINAGTKEGHTFAGWEAPDGVVLADSSAAETTFTMPAGDVTLTAKWTANNHTVTIVNGGENVAGSGTYAYGTEVTINAGTKEGYVFSGWKAPDGVTLSSTTNSETTFTMPDQDVTVTANWTTGEYAVVINEGGTGASGAGAHEYQSVVTINAGTKAGHTFAGWEAPDNIALADSSAAETTFTMPAGDVTLTAKWTANNHAVTIDNGGENVAGSGTYAYGTEVTINAGTKEGYVFSGWQASDGVTLSSTTNSETTFTMPDQDVTVTANWTTGEYAVVINEGGTGASGAGAHEYQSVVTINAGTKEGHTFAGWEASNGVVLADSSAAETTFTMPAGDVTLTAKWTANNHTVTIIDGGENVAGSGTYAYGTEVTINAGTKEGYIFSGWQTSDGVTLSSTTNSETTFAMPDQDVTVTANWAEIPPIATYTVTIQGGGEGVRGAGSYPADEQVTINAGTKPGYSFKEWTASEGVVLADATSANTTFTMPAADVGLTATWTADVHAVTINNGGEGASTSGDRSTDSTVTIYAGTKSGYTFAGWTSDDVTFNDSSAVTTAFVMPARDVTVSAQWTRNESGSSSGGGSASSHGSDKSTGTAGDKKDRTPEKAEPKADQDKKDHAESISDSTGPIQKGYISGYPNGTMHPDQNMTRAETAAILCRILSLSKDENVAEPLDHWAAEDVATVKAAGLMKGYLNGEFGYDRPLTRAELIVVIVRAKGYAPQAGPAFSDLTNHWAAADIATAAAEGVVVGYPDGTMHPDATVTRAEAVTMINRAFGIKAQNLPTESKWVDIDRDHWAYKEFVAAELVS